LVAQGTRGRVERAGEGVLASDHPDFALWPLELAAQGGNDGQVLWWGDTLFARGSQPARPEPDAALLAYTGLFGDGTPWFRTRLVVRGDALVSDLFGPIVPREGGFWSARSDAGGTDRMWLTQKLGGRLHVLNFCGAAYRRIV
ncbi:hypothetical protein MTR62_17650, partial [Novosphingobium sp. 1949]